MADIAVTGVDRILRKAGASKVSFKAAEKLRDIIEELALEICSETVILTHHAGRKIVKPADISLAHRLWKARNEKQLVIENESHLPKKTGFRAKLIKLLLKPDTSKGC